MSALIIALLAVPAAGAGLLALLPLGNRSARALAVTVTGTTLAVAVAMAVGFDYGNGAQFQGSVDRSWLPAIGVHFHLGVDGISLPLVLLTALLTLLCAVRLVSPTDDDRSLRQQLAVILLLQVGMLGTFVALDLVVFFLFFEVVLIPMYFLIAVWGGPARTAAATKFILFTLFGSALMLVGFLVLGHAAGTFDMTALAHSGGSQVSHATQLAAFVLLLVGFGVKAPMWPLHTWLPDAHTEAPTVGSVLLAGVLLKMGTYGLVRIAITDLPYAAHRIAPALAVLAVAGIVYASLACLGITAQPAGDLKRLIAFSSVGHMGFVLLGVATLTPTGIQGALIGNVAHGVITGLLFFLVGGVKDRFHTSDMTRLGGGLLAKAPPLGRLLLVTCIASLGLPGLAGFWGEMLAMLGAWHPAAGLPRPLFLVAMVAAGVGGVITTTYFAQLLRRVDFGIVSKDWRPQPVSALLPVEAAAWVPLVVLTLAIGVWPNLVLGVGQDAVHAIAAGFVT